jgi:NAD(P)-dependent dehydrogenase (short-subunit alcohol dehydrogenase family)
MLMKKINKQGNTMTNERKSIFITGAASGMGRETAKLFVAKGWFVGAYDVNQEGLANLKTELGVDKCITEKLDVTDRVEFKSVMDALARKPVARWTSCLTMQALVLVVRLSIRRWEPIRLTV